MAEVVRKGPVEANLTDYEAARRSFRWEKVKVETGFFAAGSGNAGYLAVDRHLETWRRNKAALIWRGEGGVRQVWTFQDLARASNRVANALRSLGVERGDRIFLFLPRIPELYLSFIGTIKAGAVAAPLFSAFGPEAVRDRVGDAEGRVLITTPDLYARVTEVLEELPSLRSIVVVGAPGDIPAGALDFAALVAGHSERFIAEPMLEEDPLYILYTSGTTGKPKGVVHAHGDVIQQYATTRWVLDVRDEDVYWCTADPGWVTGVVYGILGPWLNGATQVVCAGRFAAEEWYRTIAEERVNVWYTAPTSLRLLMKAGDDVTRRFDLSSLRFAASVGEPLNPEVIRWGLREIGLPIHDNWWQTETGSILIANFLSQEIRLGSMGRPVPGVEAAIVDEEGRELPPGTQGYLAVRPGWPSLMRSIWRNEEKYREYFRIPGWYVSGDTAYRDEDGYFWFVGRADDVINTSGHRVGPFEVESALLEHPAVAEAGVIGKPDAERGEIIKAFISLREGHEPSEELKLSIQEHVRKRLSFHAYPREIDFRAGLPKTRSGKIMRRLLKAEELGLPVGDVSTLED